MLSPKWSINFSYYHTIVFFPLLRVYYLNSPREEKNKVFWISVTIDSVH